MIESASRHLLPLDPNHHNVDGIGTWLDLILTSAPSVTNQLLVAVFFRHDLFYLSYILKPPKPALRYICVCATLVEWI